MYTIPANFYTHSREQANSLPACHEGNQSAQPAERLLQGIWLHQRLLREQLRTLDGQSLRVLHPGFWNREAGPDFRGAVLQFGGESPRSGDVEVDLQSSGWRDHGHDQNPSFRKVVLHVVWSADKKSNHPLPTIALESFLDGPLSELSSWLGNSALEEMPSALLGQCSAPLRNLDATRLSELLRQAAQSRFKAKAVQFQARARQCGWEQSLWEGLFRSLGYKHNIWPMQRLAELLPELGLRSSPNKPSILVLQATLLGVGGLLPLHLIPDRPSTNHYLREIWDVWWRERENASGCILPRTLWCFHGLRPANHPQRRLALAAHWLGEGHLLARLEKWFQEPIPDRLLPDSLLKLLQVAKDDFWSWHCTFRSSRLAKPQPLLGSQRATDIAINVILPWFWARADSGRNPTLKGVAIQRYFAWPRGEDNSLLRLARQRLLGGALPRSLASAAAQQGLLQIVRDFCAHSNAICEQCGFPELVRSLQS